MIDDRPSSESIRIAQTISTIIGRFEQHATVRDRAISESRLIVRLAANTIRATHRGDHDDADALSEQASQRLRSMLEDVRQHPNLYWSGYVQDAVKEVAESRITAAIIRDQLIPGPDEIGAEDPAYLNALAEAASELRRQILDQLRAGLMDEAERLFHVMDDIYAGLLTVDFADAITGGLRRSTDQLRGVLERTRGDLTVAVRQDRLEATLRETNRRLNVSC